VAIPLLLFVLAAPGGWPFLFLLVVSWVVASSEGYALLRRGLLASSALAAFVAAWAYVGLAVLALGLLRVAPPIQTAHRYGIESGTLLLLVLFLTTWAGDSAAYFVGRGLGRHKMAPTISPGKTWEGAAANLAASVLVSWAVSAWLALPAWLGVSVGVIIGVLGQAGDLLESWVKRRAGVKDSGTLLPGHGGLLDRIDSMLLPAPFLWLLFALACRIT
jgi:phosphatidate cytidylyltransferase